MIRTALAALALTSATVQAQTLEDIAQTAHAAAPAYALGVAQAIGTAEPEVRTFGTIHKGSGQSVDPDTPWHIGSISKSFTATLILQLADEQALSLDAPIAGYLPDETLHADWQAITLRQLLSHTSGLPANAGILAFRKRGVEDIHALRREVLSGYWDKPIKGTSGTYNYSNLGYVLAGYIAEEITGQSWEDLIRTRIAGPLNLTSLGFGAPQQHGAAWGHRNYVLVKRPVSPDSTGADNPPWLGPAGTIHLSLADLARWGQAHLAACRGENPAFLSQSRCQEMQAVVQDSYGLGWVIRDTEVGPMIWHNGSNTMWYAVLALLPDQDRVIVAATNVFDTAKIDQLIQEARVSTVGR